MYAINEGRIVFSLIIFRSSSLSNCLLSSISFKIILSLNLSSSFSASGWLPEFPINLEFFSLKIRNLISVNFYQNFL
jgi:hypothetical protein